MVKTRTRRDAVLVIGLLSTVACLERKKGSSLDGAARHDSLSGDVVSLYGTGGTTGEDGGGRAIDGAQSGAGGGSSDGLGTGGSSGGAGGQRESTAPPATDAAFDIYPSPPDVSGNNGGTGGVAGNGTGGMPGSGGAADAPIQSVDARACSDTTCDVGFYCNSGVCTPTIADGKPCSADAQCSHSHCVSGTCCNTGCGTCHSCLTGTCNLVPAGSPCSAAGGSVGACDTTGGCNACSSGAACTDGINAACQTGATDCSTGKPVCKASNKSGSCGAGPSCSAGYSTGQSTCVNGACSTPAAVKCQSGSCDGLQCLSCSSAPGASAPPTAINGASSTPICPGASVSLTVSGGSLGAGASWVWTANSSYLTATTEATVSVSPASTTTYAVYAEGSCNKTTPAPSAVVKVAIAPAFAQNPQSQSVPCGAASLAVSVTPVTGTTVSSYEWHRSLASIPGDDWVVQDGAYFAGQGTPTLTVVPADTQSVWCVIRDTCARSASSSHATLTVPDPSTCM
jgi:hypothetical protein